MNSPIHDRLLTCRIALGFLLVWGAATFVVRSAQLEPVVIYQTSFEVAEGYAAAAEEIPLWDQGMGWLAEGSGGSGVVTNFFEGWGQQAFIGYAPPAYKDEIFNVWRPVEVAAPPPGYSVVRFATLMQISDSTNQKYDDFRWSVYNTANQRLFTLDFDNYRAEIFYSLDDNKMFQPAGFTFLNDQPYVLEIFMNFARNNWQALLNGQVVVDSQPITTANARLDLSDVDAVWALREKGKPGDNYLLFDDYSITAEPTPTIPPTLEIVGRHPAGEFELILHGERGLKYAIDVADQAEAEWFPLQTNAPPDGVWRFVDDSAKDYPTGIYRARQVVP